MIDKILRGSSDQNKFSLIQEKKLRYVFVYLYGRLNQRPRTKLIITTSQTLVLF